MPAIKLGAALAMILALSYLRFLIDFPDVPVDQLYHLGSYLTWDVPALEKIIQYFKEYFIGISPWYWYLPNERDLARHLMKGYGNIMLATLPFALLGLAHIVRTLRESAHRTVLIALLTAPMAAALVQTGITRALAFVVPAAILTGLGLDRALAWVENPADHLADLARGKGITRGRVLSAVLILLPGMLIILVSKEFIDRVVVGALTALLALQASGVFERIAHHLFWKRLKRPRKIERRPRAAIVLIVFAILSGTNIFLLQDALGNGPTWYRDYDLGGMQYGAFQVFDQILEYQLGHPDTQIILSPNWTNGAMTVARFFLGDPLPITLASIESHLWNKLPLRDEMLFIMTSREFDRMTHSGKFKDVHVERILPYPDGSPGFYFARLRYVDTVDDRFAAEAERRQILYESMVTIDDQEVIVRHSRLDAGAQADAIRLIFDDNPQTLAKTAEANPLVVELTFPEPREITGFSLILGSAYVRITLECYPTLDAQPIVYTIAGGGTARHTGTLFRTSQISAGPASSHGDAGFFFPTSVAGSCMGVQTALAQLSMGNRLYLTVRKKMDRG
ncbi:MAG: hypothetical protein FJZ87_02225 [Chloroflexi bacterium]|nr:hypothetical protein [Chloroflexota bacterium]